MAVIKAPALSLAASGNLGGLCYSRWRGLAVARKAWEGIVPNTTPQVEMQDLLETVSKAWSGTLTEAERSAWRSAASSEVSYAALGLKYTPTGFNYFVRINFQVLRRGLNLLRKPPLPMEPNGMRDFWAIWSGAAMAVELNATLLKTPPSLKLYWESWRAGPYSSGGRHALPGEFRFIEYYTDWVSHNVFGLTPSVYYWFRARWSDASGRVGNWFEDQVYIEM